MELTVQGQTVFAATGGRPFTAAGPVVVFLHGAAMDHTCWSSQTRYFAHHGFGVLAPDLPGHGRSGGQALASVEALADWVLALLDAAGAARAALVGHSLGSLVALETAGKAPARVAALGLLATAVPMAVNPAFQALARDETPKAIGLMMEWSFARANHLGGSPTPGLWMTGAATRLVERAAPGLLAHDLGVAAGYAGGLAAAAKVACPTVLILGAADQMTPRKAADAAAKAIAGSRTTVIPGAGHMMMAERPDETLAALRSLLG
jgi:pimeloyl-ACP methyl ester carboxylesterase